MLRAFDFEAALDQLAGAGADQVARRTQRQRRSAFAVEHEIERGDQVGGGVDQGAVEVEDNGAREASCAFASGSRTVMQVGAMASEAAPLSKGGYADFRPSGPTKALFLRVKRR